MNRQKVLDAFQEYISNYDMSNNMIRLKRDHTYRVASLCQQIAESLGLSKEDIDMAWLSGMLHDLGRFEQWERFRTFQDAVSIDHAQFSSRLLFDDGLIRRFVEEDSEDLLMKKVVSLHNVYRLPEDLTKRELMFCDILRDADKIDILKVHIDFSFEEIYNCTTEALLHTEISPEVLECIKEEHTVLKSLRKTPVDNMVGHISLVFELVYPISRQILLRLGYLDKLFEFQSENLKTLEDFEYISKKVTNFLNHQENHNDLKIY